LVRAVEPHCAEQTAERLLKQFGSLGQLLAESRATLSASLQSGALVGVIVSAKAMVLESLREQMQRVSFDLNDPDVLCYLAAVMQNAVEERCHAIFLDTNLGFITEELIAAGDWSAVRIRLRPLMRRAVELDAANLVLFHNHPSGRAEPSAQDIEFTLVASGIAEALGICIYDHLIVAGPRVFSMRAAGIL
jgi:DNA repair protein RadC